MFKGFRLGPTRTIALGFALLILAGAGLLCIPAASRNGVGIPFINALFTSTSATCVTGLVVYDTWTQFSLFGQAVILVLIQVGGLGFMTIAMLFSIALGRRIGLKQRSLLAEAINLPQIGGVVRLSRRILLGTFVLEGAGAVLIAIRFCPLLGFWRGVWYGVFHSVSAFCNAGFDLMGRFSPGSSLTSFAGDALVVGPIMALIVLGGLGFLVWQDVLETRFSWHKMKLHTRVVLVCTGALLLGGALLFLLLERNASQSGMSFGERALASLFASVTPRTAGFNTVELSSMSGGGTLLTIIFMVIGASPGSTGGGAKITTFAVMLAAAVAAIRGRDDVNVACSRLENTTIRRAFTNFIIYMAMLLLGTVIILCAQDFSMTDALYEAASAIGTVGLTRGITGQLNGLSKAVVMLLMYAGRVGSLTVFLAISKTKTGGLRNPVGNIIVG